MPVNFIYRTTLSHDDSNRDHHLHSGCACRAVPLKPHQYDHDEVGQMYHMRFPDGWEADAFEDELIAL